MTKIAKHARELLTPYANVWADMVEKIEALDADELADLTKACDSPTNMNCWWAIKAAADFLKPVLDEEYRRRTALEVRRADEAFRKLG